MDAVATTWARIQPSTAFARGEGRFETRDLEHLSLSVRDAQFLPPHPHR